MIWRKSYFRNIFQRANGTQYAGIGIHATRDQAQHLAMLQKPDNVELVYRVRVTPKYPKRKQKP